MDLYSESKISCFDADDEIEAGPCRGDLEMTVSKSGVTSVMRCEEHARRYHDRMEKLEEDLQSRYPGYDNPHSTPPSWFDPAYAGEEW